VGTGEQELRYIQLLNIVCVNRGRRIDKKLTLLMAVIDLIRETDPVFSGSLRTIEGVIREKNDLLGVKAIELGAAGDANADCYM
jgi:hypothetical protein